MNKILSILKGLFTSKVRVKLLEHFLTHSNDSFYLRQLEKLLNEPGSPIGRELLNLEKIGILKSHYIGNQKHYQVNKEIIMYEELRMIFLKTTIGQVIKKHLSVIEGIELAFIYGSFAKGEEFQESDIDIMIVGNLMDKEVNKAISHSEKDLNRTINYSLYERKEVKARLKNKDNFILTVFGEPHIIILGSKNDELFRVD